ncbi:MAG: signal peptidase I [Burkholderia sp.]|nr:signal peptidase I [Burkholderia sp.]
MNFPIILFILVIVTGIVWLIDKLSFFQKRRQFAIDKEVNVLDKDQDRIDEQFIVENINNERERLRNNKQKKSCWLEYIASFFPVIFIVFLVRSFVVEPFNIPSNSMSPTLISGDFILVNKFNYGLRMPIINMKITQGRAIERGDVVVFRYPNDKSINYIKRVIGLPGDTIEYIDKQLRINGKPVPEIWITNCFDDETKSYVNKFEETFGNRKNMILKNPLMPPLIIGTYNYPYRDNCIYSSQGISCKVPINHYFMMGDNRDNSADSRYWGFVSDDNIVGHAFFIWMNFRNFNRIGSFN